MNSDKMRLSLALGFCLISGYVFARELRTPSSLGTVPHFHHSLSRPTDADMTWNADVWAAVSQKSARNVFTDDHGTKTDSSLTGIMLAKESFVGLDSFATGATAPYNSSLYFAQMTPRYSYKERTAALGFVFEYGMGSERQWRCGVRTSLPFKQVDVELDSAKFEESLEDVCVRHNEYVDASALAISTGGNFSTGERIDDAFAYRLDYLSSLYKIGNGVGATAPLLQYPTTGGVEFLNNTVAGNDTSSPIVKAPVYLISKTDGKVPTGQFTQLQTAIDTYSFLAESGSGVANNGNARFFNGTNYATLAADKATQRQLWVAPGGGENADTNDFDLLKNASTIRNTVQSLGGLTGGSATHFFGENGVSFETQRHVGLGNLLVDFYVNREWHNHFGELIVGVGLPTGGENENPKNLGRIFATGNDKHFELKLGGVYSYQPATWFFMKFDASYSHAFKAKEKVAAPYKGATVKNIGPTINADISWCSAVGHADFVFMVPSNPRAGVTLGYEWYGKTQDRVSLEKTTETDFLGTANLLDANVLKKRTAVLAHKVRAEVFHQGDFWELFGGFSHAIAGRNAPKATEVSLGLVAYF